MVIIKDEEIGRYVGKRKHYTQLNDAEKDCLLSALRSINHFGISRHALDRLHEKHINVKYNELITLIDDSNIIEYKIDEAYNGYDERVVLRGKSIFMDKYNLVAVYSITNKKIITVWVNTYNDNHSTLDEGLYDKDMKVFGVI